MATIVHYRNKILQDAPIRILDPSADKSIMLFPDDRIFKIDALGVATPSVIHFIAKTINIPVFPTFSASPGATLTNITNTSCELTFNNTTLESVKVYAKVTFEGIEYVAEETIKKIIESKRGPGAFYVTGDSWSDSAADAATLGDNLVGDTVTISNGMSYVEQRRWSGTAWEVLNIAVDGGKITLDSITAAMIKNGVITTAKFASGIEPVAITDYVPTTKATSTIYNTADKKLYVWDANINAYSTQKFISSDLQGTLNDAQIASVAAGKVTGQLTDAQIAAVNGAKITGSLLNSTLPAAQVVGQLTNAQIAAVDGAKLTGSITNATLPAGKVIGQLISTQIQDGAILHDKIAVDAVYQNNIAAGAISAKQLAIGDFENLVNCGSGINVSGFIAQGTGTVTVNTLAELQSLNANYWNPIGEQASYSLSWNARDTFFGPEFPVNNRDEFYFSMLTIPAGGLTNNYTYNAGFILYDVNNNPSYPMGCTRAIGTSGGHKAEGMIVIPAGAVRAKVYLLIDAPTSTNWSSAGNGGHIASIQIRKRNGGSLIVDGAITANKVAANAITADKIVANAITTGKIAAAAITANELAAGSVTTAKLVAGSVTTNELATNAVTADKIAANSITTNKLLVTGKGKALNDDPSMVDPTAWSQGYTGGYFRIIDSVSGGNSCFTAPGRQRISSRTFPVVSGKRYKFSLIARNWQGTGNLYLRAYMLTWDNVTITQVVRGVTPVTTNLENVALNNQFTQFVGYADAPANACQAYIRVEVNTTDSTAITDVLDVRCEEYIGADLIVDGSISARHIAANTITAAQITAGTITAAELATNSITAAKIQAGAITAGKLDVGSVQATNMAANSVTANAIAANAITAGKIAANAVTAGSIASDAVTAGTIAAAAISSREIAAGSITTDKLAIISRGLALNSDTGPSDIKAWQLSNVTLTTISGSSSGTTAFRSSTARDISTAFDAIWSPIQAGKTYRLTVSARGVNGGANMYARIQRANSSGTQVGDFTGIENVLVLSGWQTFTGTFVAEATAVLGRVILFMNYGGTDDGGYQLVQNIKFEEVLPGTLIQDGAITTVKIAAAAITADQIAANAVTADKIVAGAITSGKIAANAVTAGTIAANAVTAGAIAAGAVTADKITATSLSAISSNLGAATAGSININNRFIVDTSGQVTITAPNTGAGYTVTDSAGMRVYDGSNVLRVRIGIW